MKKLTKHLICLFAAVSMTAAPMQVMAANNVASTSTVAIAPRAITTTKPDLVIPYLGTGEIFRDCGSEPYVVYYKVPLKFSFSIDSKDRQYIEVREYTKNHEENIYASKVIYRGNARCFSYSKAYTDETTYVYFTVKNMANGSIKLANIKVSY